MQRIELKKELAGRILDIGGGGEGVIGRLYGQNVTAIDNSQEELDEAPDTCTKVWMNAAALSFEDESFDHVTFFFSLMYMDGETQQEAIKEAARVVRKGGSVSIWDAEISSAYPNPFLLDLCIDMDGTVIDTTYGIVKRNAAQNAETFLSLCDACGLVLISKERYGSLFSLIFEK